MNFKDGMMSHISTIVAVVVKLDSLLHKKLEKMSCKADWITSVLPALLQDFIYIQYENLVSSLKMYKKFRRKQYSCLGELLIK